MAIRDRLTDGQIAFTRAELKIVRQLLSNYPAAGLNTVAHLAAAAGVSNPTVVRFTSKLGYEGYPEFQAALLGEVQERMSSPLSMLDTRKPSLEQENFYQYFLRASIHALESSMQMLPPHDFEAAVEAGADLSMRVHCLGGRFSGFLAGLLWSHMKQLRAETHWINGSQADQVDRLVDSASATFCSSMITGATRSTRSALPDRPQGRARASCSSPTAGCRRSPNSPPSR